MTTYTKPPSYPSGYKDYGDGAGASWAVFPASMSDDEIVDTLEGDGWTTGAWYGGPGQPFCRSISLRRSLSRVLVTQYHALDI